LTLVVGFVWGPGVLVASDSRASGGPVFFEERKVRPIFFLAEDGREFDLALVGGAGDAAVAKQGFLVVERVFREWFVRVGVREGRNPLAGEFEELVGEVESRLMRRYRELRGLGVEPSTSLLLAGVTQDAKPMLYVFDERGLAEPMHDNPGYALLGKGVVTGGLLLLRLLGFRLPESAGWDLGLLTAFMIDMVSEVDPTVSPFLGESYYIRYDKAKGRVVSGPLREEAYREYKRRVRMRREVIRLLWRILEELEEGSEERVAEALRALRGKSGGAGQHRG